MKLAFYIIRHGKTLFNSLNKVQGWCDSPLTNEGIEVVKRLAKGFTVHFDAAYCSDLKRTYQTADIILKTKQQEDLPIIELPALKECCFGSYESDYTFKMWTDIAIYLHYITPEALNEALLKKEISHKDILSATSILDRLGIAETFEQVGERAYNALIGIADCQSLDGIDKNILVVSHGMTILVLMNMFGASDLIKGHLENGGVCKVNFENGKFSVESVGDMSYFK